MRIVVAAGRVGIGRVARGDMGAVLFGVAVYRVILAVHVPGGTVMGGAAGVASRAAMATAAASCVSPYGHGAKHQKRIRVIFMRVSHVALDGRPESAL